MKSKEEVNCSSDPDHPVFVVIPVFNRRETTLACLRLLRQQSVMDWAKVVVVDDASTDGTVGAIRTAFPDVVVLEGSGSLWWGGGINLGMEYAVQNGAESVVWLNDDCEPQPGSLKALVAVSFERQVITVAPCLLRETGRLHYGGLNQTRWGLDVVSCEPGQDAVCDTVCGNCVCVPRVAIDRIGMIDTATFPHFAADADYGLRAREAGIGRLVVGSAICFSTYGSNKNRESWLFGRATVRELWRACFHPKGGVLSLPGFWFKWRHWGGIGLIGYTGTLLRLVATSILRSLLPADWLRRVFGNRSRHHLQMEAVRAWEESQKTLASDVNSRE